MAPIPPTIQPNPFQATVSPGIVSASGQPLPLSSSSNDIDKAHEAFSSWAKEALKTSKSLQSDVRALRDAGHTFEEVERRMKEVGLTGKYLEKAMSGYHRSLKELSELPIGQVFSEWKTSLMSLGKAFLPLISLDLLARTFSALDEAGTQLNRSLAGVAIQSGAVVRGRGIGGLGGSIDVKGAKDFSSQAENTTTFMMRLGYSAEQAGEVMATVAKSLPSSVSITAAPQFAKAAAAIATTYGMEVGTATDLLVTSLRRGATTGKELHNVFDSVRQTAKNSNLSVEETTKSMTQLWNASYRYGGTLPEATDLMIKYKTALRDQLLTSQEMASMQSQAGEAGPGNVMALATMARKYAPGSDITKLFGTSNNPLEVLGAYMENQGKIVTGQADLTKTIVENMAKEQVGRGASPDALLGQIFILFKNLPQVMGQGVTTAEARGLGYGGLGAIKGKNIPSNIGDIVATNFKDVSDQSLTLANVFQGLTKQASNFGKILMFETGSGINRNAPLAARAFISPATAITQPQTVVNLAVTGIHDVNEIVNTVGTVTRRALTRVGLGKK